MQMSLNFERVRAIEFISNARGGSQAKRIRCSDGNTYIVKLPNNPQGDRVLINEWVASTLARAVGLSIPDFAQVEVDRQFYDENPDCRITLGTRTLGPVTGTCFGSMALDGKDRAVYEFLPDTLLAGVRNLNEFWGAMALDVWLANADGRQAVFYRDNGGFVARMIDFGFCFNGPHWTLPSDCGCEFPRRCVYEGGTKAIEPWVDRIRSLRPSDVVEAFDSLPEEWREWAPDPLADLQQIVLRRRLRLGELLDEKFQSRRFQALRLAA